MNWRDAFLEQARSDYKVMQRMNVSGVESCHRVHYLQMVTEKLAKAMITKGDSNEPPKATHATFVRALQVLKSDRVLRERLGYANNVEAFNRFVNSVLPAARRIEALAPAIAGFLNPNPEYPWRDSSSREIVAPSQFAFLDFEPPMNSQLHKLFRLVEKLLTS